MKPLKMNRCVLTWFCVYPPESNATKLKKLSYIAFAVLTFAINIMSSVSDAAYFYKSLPINLEESLLALMQLIANATMVYVIVITFLLRQKIVAIIESLTTIYENSKSLFKVYLN